MGQPDNLKDSLQDLNLKDTYSSQYDDLVNDFYNVVLEKAVRYDRVTGFFSPKVLAAAARGFSHLVKNHGMIRLITSVEVDPEIYKVASSDFIDEHYINIDDWKIDAIENEMVKDYLGVLSYLLKEGNLEIKIAIVPSDSGIFHQKVGIVTDKYGNQVSFSGSNNETVHGWLYNIEKYYIFNNWSVHAMTYFESDKNEFEDLWNNRTTVKVLPLSTALKEKVIVKTARPEDIDVVVARLNQREKENVSAPDDNGVVKKVNKLRDYQEDAIKHWKKHDFVSVFEMATGTGKTFTTAAALKEFRKTQGFLRAVVAVPLTTLAVQWQETIEKNLEDVVTVNTTTDNSWRNKIERLLNLQELGVKKDLIIITTYSMFNKKSFTELITPVLDNESILIADEMHNLVTKRGLNSAANAIYKYKLGLSATPNRLWKPEDSKKVIGLFGDNKFEFSLKEAIDQEYLVPFNYYPVEVELTQKEWGEYLRISRKIGLLLSGMSPKDIDENDARFEDLQTLMRNRARIKKNAENKLAELEKILLKMRAENNLDHALIYADNEKYLSDLQRMLSEDKIITSRIVGETDLKERLNVIDSLRTGSIEAIVAIKCLDEGVDIPSAKKAFILSNNTDPREYVQRLGRVLRLDPESEKDHADVYDFLVTPPAGIVFEDEKEQNVARNMIRNEQVRAKFFTDLALNQEEAAGKTFDMADAFRFIFTDNELCYNDDNEE